MLIGYGVALFFCVMGIQFFGGLHWVSMVPVALSIILATIAAINWRINVKKDAMLFAALKNPPKFSMKRYAHFVTLDVRSIAIFLEHVLCEFQEHTGDWDNIAIARILGRARETAQIADNRDYSGRDTPFYSYSRLHRSQYRKIFYAFKLAVVGHVFDNDWEHEFNVIAQKLSMNEVIARLEKAMEKLEIKK